MHIDYISSTFTISSIIMGSPARLAPLLVTAGLLRKRGQSTILYSAITYYIMI